VFQAIGGEVHNLCMSKSGGVAERSASSLSICSVAIDVCSVFDQEAYSLEIASVARIKERCPSIYIRVIYICTILDKSLGFVDVSVFASNNRMSKSHVLIVVFPISF
jgi:hypothetical protein